MVHERKKVLEINHALKCFPVSDGKTLTAVNDVTCNIYEKECLAVIGESGCGKSTLAKLVMGVEPMTDGEVLLNGKKITDLKGKEQKDIWRQMQMIFQNASDVVSPRMKIQTFLEEPFENFHLAGKEEAKQRILTLLKEVRLDESCLKKYPHQLSGGELQRVCIARAFAMKPGFLVCDEITSALDVSVQDGVMKLFRKMQQETGTSCLFICHDLALVHDYSDRVMVMYLGHAVEVMKSEELGTGALHPYTQALLGAMFFVSREKEKNIRILSGEAPSPVDLPKGCCFSGRCPRRTELCMKQKPELKEVTEGHFVACHHLKIKE